MSRLSPPGNYDGVSYRLLKSENVNKKSYVHAAVYTCSFSMSVKYVYCCVFVICLCLYFAFLISHQHVCCIIADVLKLISVKHFTPNYI